MIRSEPIFTDTYDQLDLFTPSPGSVYLIGTSVEERSAHSKEWEARTNDVQFIRIVAEDEDSFLAEVSGHERRVSVRSIDQITALLTAFAARPLYLDITGLSHHVWAPVLRIALDVCSDVKAVYVEPASYTFSATPTEGEIFDLSERIRGIRPIAGFTSLVDADQENVCFVPLLGFEGTRLAYLLENVQPTGDRIVPVVGVPGFRPEYPFYTYHGNRSALSETKAWRNVRFAVANCPFSLFYCLQRIRAEYPGSHLMIAPIGTKPHALGAVLYRLTDPVEIVYDHPIRKATRTTGTSRLLVYHLSVFSSGRA